MKSVKMPIFGGRNAKVRDVSRNGLTAKTEVFMGLFDVFDIDKSSKALAATSLLGYSELLVARAKGSNETHPPVNLKIFEKKVREMVGQPDYKLPSKIFVIVSEVQIALDPDLIMEFLLKAYEAVRDGLDYKREMAILEEKSRKIAEKYK